MVDRVRIGFVIDDALAIVIRQANPDISANSIAHGNIQVGQAEVAVRLIGYVLIQIDLERGE